MSCAGTPDKPTVLVLKWAYYLDGELRKTMPGLELWLDNTNQIPGETVDEIVLCLAEGLIES